MHKVQINAAGALALSLPAGSYVIDDSNTGEFLLNQWIDGADKMPADRDTGLLSRLYIRAGGYGDLIQLTAVLQALHERQPDIRIGVACIERFASVFQNLPFPIETVPYPVPADVLDQWGSYQSLEGVIENNSLEFSLDLLAKAVLGDALTSPKPVYLPTGAEMTLMQERFPRIKGQKRLGIQIEASASCRTWSGQNISELAQRAIGKGWEVYLFGAPKALPVDFYKIKAYLGAVTNLTMAEPFLDFRESAALATSCDVLVTPDSSFVHLAGAMDLPTVAIYGPFHWKTRTLTYQTVRVIQGRAQCAPCCHQVHAGQEWPSDGPCQTLAQKRCLAMEDVQPRRVMAAVTAMAEKFADREPWSLPADVSVVTETPAIAES
jgi:ADP-heptose:LPS heptosyltransferase